MKKLLYLLLILCSYQNYSYSQDQHAVDSFETQLKNHYAHRLELGKNVPPMYDTIIAWTLNDLADAYVNSNPDTAMVLARQSLAIAEELGYKRGKAYSWNNMGLVNFNKGDYAAAIEFYKKAAAIRIEMGNRKGLAWEYQQIGTAFEGQGNYADALKNYFAALRINEEVGNKPQQASNLQSIGNIHLRQNNYPDALKYLSAALKLYEELGNKTGMGDVYIFTGITNRLQNNYPEALKYLLSALKIWEEAGDKISMASAQNEIGIVYTKQGNYPEALRYLQAALKTEEEIGDQFGLGYSYNNIAEIYMIEKKYAQSAEYFNKSMAVANITGNIDAISSLYGSLASLDSAQGNFRQALDHYKQHISFRDSLWSSENTKKMTQQQMQYDFDKKQVADSLQFAQEKELAAVKLQKQKAITYGGFAGTGVTVILLFFVYRNYNKQRIANQKLKEAQEQLIKSEKLAAFGVMASRVSHEIQNPLNFVNNFSDLAEGMVHDIVKSNSEQERHETAKDLIDNLQKIKQHGKRADTIVKQLQEHTSKGTAHEYFEAG